MCEVKQQMQADEKYVRLRLTLSKSQCTEELAQYASDIQKLRLAHEERCPACKA